MLELVIENSFDKDYKRELKSGLEKQTLLDVVNKLQARETLETKYRDHPLRDLLLIYQIKAKSLHLVRLGSHSKLFKK